MVRTGMVPGVLRRTVFSRGGRYALLAAGALVIAGCKKVPEPDPGAERQKPGSAVRSPEPPVMPGQVNEPGQIKKLTELTAQEQGIVSDICRKAIADHFGDKIRVWYNTTYNYLPESDGWMDPSAPAKKKRGLPTKLKKPISLPSGVGLALALDPKRTKQELAARVERLSAIDDAKGRRYAVLSALILLEPSAMGGGLMGMGSDKVTIIPQKVAIYKK